MMAFLSVLLLAICVFLIFLVLSQDVKGGGLAGALGGATVQSAFGGRSAQSITKLTAWMALVFLLLVLFMLAVTRLRPLTMPREMPVSRLDVEPHRHQYALGGAVIAVTIALYIAFW